VPCSDHRSQFTNGFKIEIDQFASKRESNKLRYSNIEFDLRNTNINSYKYIRKRSRMYTATLVPFCCVGTN
jgi:hypothetical protein